MSSEGTVAGPSDPRRLSPDEVRELDEVRKALGELEPEDLGRLLGTAGSFLGGFGTDPQARNYEDLLSTAIRLTLAGKRQWRRGWDLRRHLFWTMRSLASIWRREVARKQDVLSLSDLDSLEDHLETPDRRPSPERMMIIRQTLRAIYQHFADDAAATRVLQLIARGQKGPAIRGITGMTKKQLSTTMKRIRRYARRGDYDDVQ